MLSGDSKIIHQYDIGSDFRGYAAKLTDKEIEKILSSPSVKYIERNQVINIAPIVQRQHLLLTSDITLIT